VADRLGDVHPKSLRMEAKADPKPLRKDEFNRVIGVAIEEALRRSGIEKKAASLAMGYAESGQSTLSAWIAGDETPNFARLWMLGDRFRLELVVSLAKSCAVGVRVNTSIEISQQAVNQ